MLCWETDIPGNVLMYNLNFNQRKVIRISTLTSRVNRAIHNYFRQILFGGSRYVSVWEIVLDKKWHCHDYRDPGSIWHWTGDGGSYNRIGHHPSRWLGSPPNTINRDWLITSAFHLRRAKGKSQIDYVFSILDLTPTLTVDNSIDIDDKITCFKDKSFMTDSKK